MTDHRIMYVCSECADECPEQCGRFDRGDLRVVPDGRWLCEGCFERPFDPETDEFKNWTDMFMPPQYGPTPAPQLADSAPTRSSVPAEVREALEKIANLRPSLVAGELVDMFIECRMLAKGALAALSTTETWAGESAPA